MFPSSFPSLFAVANADRGSQSNRVRVRMEHIVAIVNDVNCVYRLAIREIVYDPIFTWIMREIGRRLRVIGSILRSCISERDLMPVAVLKDQRIVKDVTVEIEALRIVQLRVRHRLFLRAPVGTEEASDIAVVVAREHVVVARFGISFFAGRIGACVRRYAERKCASERRTFRPPRRKNKPTSQNRDEGHPASRFGLSTQSETGPPALVRTSGSDSSAK